MEVCLVVVGVTRKRKFKNDDTGVGGEALAVDQVDVRRVDDAHVALVGRDDRGGTAELHAGLFHLLPIHPEGRG